MAQPPLLTSRVLKDGPPRSASLWATKHLPDFWARRGNPHRRRDAVWLLGAIVAVGGLAGLFFAVSVHAGIGNSDGASVILEGASIARGNLWLHGWRLSLDSYWLEGALAYAAAVSVVGARPELLHAIPALLAALVVVVAMALAREQRRGASAGVAMVVVAAVLVLPTPSLVGALLFGPLHIGTVLFALVAFYGLRSGRIGWGWAVAILLFAAGIDSDLLIVTYGIVPALLAGVVASLRLRSWRAGIPSASAAVVGGLLGELVRLIVSHLGGFAIAGAGPLASPSQMLANLGATLRYSAGMLGARPGPSGTDGGPLALLLAHVILVGFLCVALVLGIVRLGTGVLGRDRLRAPTPEHPEASARTASAPAGASPDKEPRVPWYRSEHDGWHLDDMLVIAWFGSVASYLALATNSSPAYTRDLTASVVVLAILGGRVLARAFSTRPPSARRRAVTAVALGAICCFAASFGFIVARPVPVQPAQQLAAWLEAHDLHSGVGAYWCASITTLESEGDVVVRPVTEEPGERLARYGRESSASWYRGQRFDFLVFEPSAPFGGVSASTAEATFGPPSAVHRVGPYEVLTFAEPFSISPTVARPWPS